MTDRKAKPLTRGEANSLPTPATRKAAHATLDAQDELLRRAELAEKELAELALVLGYGERPEGQGHIVHATGDELAKKWQEERAAFENLDAHVGETQSRFSEAGHEPGPDGSLLVPLGALIAERDELLARLEDAEFLNGEAQNKLCPPGRFLFDGWDKELRAERDDATKALGSARAEAEMHKGLRAETLKALQNTVARAEVAEKREAELLARLAVVTEALKERDAAKAQIATLEARLVTEEQVCVDLANRGLELAAEVEAAEQKVKELEADLGFHCKQPTSSGSACECCQIRFFHGSADYKGRLAESEAERRRLDMLIATFPKDQRDAERARIREGLEKLPDVVVGGLALVGMISRNAALALVEKP